MRLSKGGLLVVVAFTVPLVSQSRTAFAWIGVEVTLLESLVLWVALVLVLLGYAFWPEPSGSG